MKFELIYIKRVRCFYPWLSCTYCLQYTFVAHTQCILTGMYMFTNKSGNKYDNEHLECYGNKSLLCTMCEYANLV